MFENYEFIISADVNVKDKNVDTLLHLLFFLFDFSDIKDPGFD